MNRNDLDNYITGHYGEDQFRKRGAPRMNRTERQSSSIAKALVKVLQRVEDFDDDPALICLDAKIVISGIENTPKTDEVLAIIELLEDYFDGKIADIIGVTP